jgi:UDP-N-acetylglucosamine 4-epimerase
MPTFDDIQTALRAHPRRWLITGCAGFIGSNLLETLLRLDQTVVGLDNLSTGFQHNLDEVRSLVTDSQWQRFTFLHGDIRDPHMCRARSRTRSPPVTPISTAFFTCWWRRVMRR